MDEQEKAELLDAISIAITALALSSGDPERLRGFASNIERTLEFSDDLKPTVRELFSRLQKGVGPMVAEYDAHVASLPPLK